MASVSNVTLTITTPTHSRSSDVTVEYDVTFDEFDISSDQPYREIVRLVRKDTDDPASATPEERLTTIVSESLLVPSAIRSGNDQISSSHRTHTRKKISNIVLDEHKPPIPDPDKIRAVVILEPLSHHSIRPTLPRMTSSRSLS